LAAELEMKTKPLMMMTDQFYKVSKKVGFDYNAYENWLENIISIGLYGFSTFNQELNSYKIYNANPYFERPPVASGV
jgi:hypothetical protein